MSLRAACAACGQLASADDGHFYVDTDTARGQAAGSCGPTRWGIAHTACLPREDYGEGRFDTVWTLYAPELPGSIGGFLELADHVSHKNWATQTDLPVFVLEAMTGTGRWRAASVAPGASPSAMA